MSKLNKLNEKKQVSVATMVVTSILCLLPIALGFILWNKLPKMIPQQYGWDDQANWSLPKPLGFILCPVLMVLINLILQLTLRLSKKPLNDKIVAIICWLIPVLSVFVNSFLVLKPAGLKISASNAVIPMVSIVFIMIGNDMPKTEPNALVGIRAPWINNNPDVWTKTQRFGGFLFVVTGFLNLATSFTSSSRQVFIISIAILMLVVLVYSLVLAAKTKNEQ